MITTAYIGLTNWLVWALTGTIGGYMAGRLLTSGGAALWLCVIIGIIAAIGGGYLCMTWSGGNNYGQTIALVGAVAACGIVLWLLSIVFKRHSDNDGE